VIEKLPNLAISNITKPIDSNWHFKRGNQDYLIFSERGGTGFQVARSSTGILGPYEKNNQFLISGDEFKEPNVIIENENYYLIFGSGKSHKVFLVSLKWEYDWPYAANLNQSTPSTRPCGCPYSQPQV